MNKTLSIALAGYSFIIDEHAYIKLGDYLKALRNSLEADEADEVMHDIEIRMVEIFKESLGKREVIYDNDVEKVMAQIGAPEQIEEQEEAYYSKTTSAKTEKQTQFVQKQLMRDPENSKIAGVCAGLAHYTGVDISLMRTLWVAIFLLGIFTAAISSTLIGLLYIIFWIVLPVATTASDFLKMKGKPMNFDNLKEESSKIVQFANDSTQKVGEFYNETKPYINKAGSGIANALRYVFGGLFALMAITLLLGSFTIFGFIGNTGNMNFFGNVGFYMKDNNMEYIILAFTFLSAFIPALLLGFISIKLLSPKTKFNYMGYVFGGLILVWLAFLGIIAYTAVKQGTLYTGENEEIENISINVESDTLHLDVNKINITDNFKSYWNNIYSDGKTIFKEDIPQINVIRDNVKAPYIVVKKEANGYNQSLKLNAPLKIENNTIYFPNYIQYDYKERFRDYDVRYDLVIPMSTTIIKNTTRGMHVYGDNDVDYDDDHYSQSKNYQKVVINGNSIEYNSNEEDSIIFNGKKYPRDRAEALEDSLEAALKSNKKLEIKISESK